MLKIAYLFLNLNEAKAPIKNKQEISKCIVSRCTSLRPNNQPKNIGLNIPPILPNVPAIAKQRERYRVGKPSGM